MKTKLNPTKNNLPKKILREPIDLPDVARRTAI
jgi:hypothetical protein